MDGQFNRIEVFEGKNLSDIFQEIYTNHTSKKEQIKKLIQSLTPLIQGIGDATLLVPLIKEYLELGVKNDEQLVKLAQIVQRMDTGRKGGDSDGFDFSDLQGLIADEQSLDQKVQETQEEAKEIVQDGSGN